MINPLIPKHLNDLLNGLVVAGLMNKLMISRAIRKLDNKEVSIEEFNKMFEAK